MTRHSMPENGLYRTLQEQGYFVLSQLLSREETDALRVTLSRLTAPEAVRQRGGSAYAIRNLLSLSPEVAALSIRNDVMVLAENALGAPARPVRATLFDKTPGANWKVPWHQDVTIAVRGHTAAPGWGPWTQKAGVLHVQPPAEVLEQMVSIRISLDAAGASNGALLVLPGTHRLGRLRDEGITRERSKWDPVVCEVPAGGALLMKPLLLHASSPSDSPHHRRVIHIDYAAVELPEGLEWAENSAHH